MTRRNLTLAMLGLLGGCGYDVGHRNEPRSVAIEVGGNDTTRQRLEIQLTRALQEALVTYSRMRPAATGHADATLRVDLRDGRNRVLVAGRPEPLSEGSLSLAVTARLTDNRTGEIIRQFDLTDRAEFRVALGETEASAIRESTFDLARKIILGLEGDF